MPKLHISMFGKLKIERIEESGERVDLSNRELTAALGVLCCIVATAVSRPMKNSLALTLRVQ